MVRWGFVEGSERIPPGLAACMYIYLASLRDDNFRCRIEIKAHLHHEFLMNDFVSPLS